LRSAERNKTHTNRWIKLAVSADLHLPAERR
jgi:hypothetical protein